MKMDTYSVYPLFSPLSEGSSLSAPSDLKVSVPGSKSLTARALMLSALSDGETTLTGIGLSDDSRHFMQCLMDLGFEVRLQEEKEQKLRESYEQQIIDI